MPRDTECHAQMLQTCKNWAEQLKTPPMVLADDTSLILEDEGYEENEDGEWFESKGNGDVVDAVKQSGYDLISGALDIEFKVNADREYKSGEVLLGFGGPNIWIDTNTKSIRGAWGGDTCAVSYQDNIGIDDALSELWDNG